MRGSAYGTGSGSEQLVDKQRPVGLGRFRNVDLLAVRAGLLGGERLRATGRRLGSTLHAAPGERHGGGQKEDSGSKGQGGFS